jgi:hypothetical protein
LNRLNSGEQTLTHRGLQWFLTGKNTLHLSGLKRGLTSLDVPSFCFPLFEVADEVLRVVGAADEVLAADELRRVVGAADEVLAADELRRAVAAADEVLAADELRRAVAAADEVPAGDEPPRVEAPAAAFAPFLRGARFLRRVQLQCLDADAFRRLLFALQLLCLPARPAQAAFDSFPFSVPPAFFDPQPSAVLSPLCSFLFRLPFLAG